CRDAGQKELRAAGVFAGMGHAQAALKMLAGFLGVAFAGDRITGAAAAVVARIVIERIRVAPLGHELGNDAMELRTVVFFGFDEANEVGDRVGGLVFEELENDIPLAGLEQDAGEIIGLCLFRADCLFFLPEFGVFIT